MDPELRQVLYAPKIPLLWEKQKGLLARRFVALDTWEEVLSQILKPLCVAELLVENHAKLECKDIEGYKLDIAIIGDTYNQCEAVVNLPVGKGAVRM